MLSQTGRRPTETVCSDQALPVPLRGAVQACLERLGMQPIRLLVGERSAPRSLNRHRTTLGAGAFDANRTWLPNSRCAMRDGPGGKVASTVGR